MRMLSLDIAKGFALIAVMVGHTSYMGVPDSIVDFCYSFDMPLFFLASGYFCKVKTESGKSFIFKNAKALLLPYVVTCAIMLLLFVVRDALFNPEVVLSDLAKWGTASLYGAGGTFPGMPPGVIGVGAVWFLLALFWGKLLLAAANKLPFTPFVIAAYFVVGYSTGSEFWLPWSIQPALCAVLFMYLGQVVREKGLLEKDTIPKTVWVFMMGAWMYCAVFFGQLYMVSNTYAHGLVDIVGGVCGSLCVIKACALFEQYVPSCIVMLFAKYGAITLPVFCMHLVELNVFPWESIVEIVSAALPLPIWIPILLLRFMLVAVMTLVLWAMPRAISGIYFRSRKRREV